MENNRSNVPIEKKYALTIEEASVYFGIGQNRILQLAKNPLCNFSIRVGDGRGKYPIKRQLFEEYLDSQRRI